MIWSPSLLVVLLAVIAAPLAAASEQSIPDPTPLQVLATSPGSEITWTHDVKRIESRQSIATVIAIEAENSQGAILRGILVQLDREGARDEIYIDRHYVRQFMNELAYLEPDEPLGEPPTDPGESRTYMEGIARCRPSQHVAQAFCPEYYTDYSATPEPEEGLFLRTPREYFRFPSVRPSALFTALALAVDQLRARTEATAES